MHLFLASECPSLHHSHPPAELRALSLLFSLLCHALSMPFSRRSRDLRDPEVAHFHLHHLHTGRVIYLFRLSCRQDKHFSALRFQLPPSPDHVWPKQLTLSLLRIAICA